MKSLSVTQRYRGKAVVHGFLMFSLVLFCTTPVMAQTQLTTYYFAGTLNDPFGTLPIGTPFCGSFSYDGSQSTNTPMDPYRGDYHYTSVSVTIDGVTVTDNGTGVLHVYDHGTGYPPASNDDTTGYPTDLFYIYTFGVSGVLGGLTLTPAAGIGVCLQDITGTVFNGPSILASNLSLSDFTTGNATFLQLQAEAMIPPATFSQFVTARGELTALSASPVQCVGAVQAAIDINPGSFPNEINLKNNGKTQVAILTTATFAAPSAVNPATVRFGATGREAAQVKSVLDDVDGDGDTDIIFSFKTQETGIVCGETVAFLTGETVGGHVIKASDSIKTTSCCM